MVIPERLWQRVCRTHLHTYSEAVGMAIGRTGARLTPDAGRAESSRGGVGTAKAAPPSGTIGDAARIGEAVLTTGDRAPAPPPLSAPRDFASKEFAPPKGTPPPAPAAGTPNAPPVASALPSPGRF